MQSTDKAWLLSEADKKGGDLHHSPTLKMPLLRWLTYVNNRSRQPRVGWPSDTGQDVTDEVCPKRLFAVFRHDFVRPFIASMQDAIA